MKFSSIVSFCLVLLVADLTSGASETAPTKAPTTKTTEKLSYPKKVSSLKKRPSKNSLKKEADITEKFKDLPTDDLAFIKELDKQFKLHGGKVKIKVENENVTESKNSKRTIEGELGYGYAHNGYEYNPPKFMFYPYSQQNIDSNAAKYFLPEEDKTQVSVEPSYSYELKPQTYITHNGPQIDVPQANGEQHHHHHQHSHEQHHHSHEQQQQQQYEEPVIVLRIPGPAKYASHLQTLLQQYLEIRAAQYLRILEEAEERKHQHHQQLQHIDYRHGETSAGAAAAGGGAVEQEPHQHHHHQVQPQHDYQQQVEYDHQIAVTPQPVQYPEIDNVYHSYKHRHPSHPEQAQQPQAEQQAYYTPQHTQQEAAGEQQHQQQQHLQHQPQYQPEYQHQHHEQEQPQFYYTHQQEYAQPEGPPTNSYQHLYLVSMSPQSPHGYEGSSHPQVDQQQQPIYVQDHHQHEAHHNHAAALPISENNPGPSHTKVLFTPKSEHVSGGDYQMYQLPSIKPNERHAPTSVPDYHQDFQPQEYLQHHGQQESQESAHNFQQHGGSIDSAQPEVVAITQRPYNYHAHSGKASARGRTGHRRRATSLKQADQGLQKIHEYVTDKLGAQTGSAVEYKTTQVIEA